MYVTQQFNAVVLGKIMSCYDSYKEEALKLYWKIRQAQRLKEEKEKSKLTPEEIMKLELQGVRNCIVKFMETGNIIDGYVWVYDYLTTHGLLSHTADERKESYIQAKQIMSKVKRKANQSADSYRQYISSIEGKRSEPVVVTAKKILLIDWLNIQVVRFGDRTAEEIIKMLEK